MVKQQATSSVNRWTLDEALKVGQVYVRNTAHLALKSAAGDLSLTVTEPGSNKTRVLNIPKGAVVDLTTLCAKQSLDQSHDLRRWIQLGMVKLLNEEEIAALKPEELTYAQTELAKLQQMSTDFQSSIAAVKPQTAEFEPAKTSVLDDADDADSNPLPEVVEAMLAFENNSANEIETLNTLKAVTLRLRSVDLDYIHTRTIQAKQIQEWLQLVTQEVQQSSLPMGGPQD